jgi:hypothetical protein
MHRSHLAGAGLFTLASVTSRRGPGGGSRSCGKLVQPSQIRATRAVNSAKVGARLLNLHQVDASIADPEAAVLPEIAHARGPWRFAAFTWRRQVRATYLKAKPKSLGSDVLHLLRS